MKQCTMGCRNFSISGGDGDGDDDDGGSDGGSDGDGDGDGDRQFAAPLIVGKGSCE